MQCRIYNLYGAKNEYLRTFNKIINVSAISNPVEKNYKIPKSTAQLEIVIVTPWKINIISLPGNCSAFTKNYDRRLPCNLSTDITLRIIDPKLTVISKRWQSKTHGYLKTLIESWWTEFCLSHLEETFLLRSVSAPSISLILTDTALYRVNRHVHSRLCLHRHVTLFIYRIFMCNLDADGVNEHRHRNSCQFVCFLFFK